MSNNAKIEETVCVFIKHCKNDYYNYNYLFELLLQFNKKWDLQEFATSYKVIFAIFI